jgi:hypothetical protein
MRRIERICLLSGHIRPLFIGSANAKHTVGAAGFTGWDLLESGSCGEKLVFWSFILALLKIWQTRLLCQGPLLFQKLPAGFAVGSVLASAGIGGCRLVFELNASRTEH